MAYSKDKIEEILNTLAETINISDSLFKKADALYDELGNWINKESEEYKVHIYPQGSFALGTVIKPVTDKEDYDVDMVCLIEKGIIRNAADLKNNIVFPWLDEYKPHKTDVEEKTRCWHVAYDEIDHFHMDVIPAIPKYTQVDNSAIEITNKEDDGDYTYCNSDPKAFADWFLNCCNRRPAFTMVGHDMAVMEDLKPMKRKTKLQKAIQILKRHRDIMFQEKPEDKPASILITTIAGELYSGETTLFETISRFIKEIDKYLIMHWNYQVDAYVITNPCCPEEEFTDKWRKHPERKDAFFAWIKQLKIDFDPDNLMLKDRVGMGNHIKKVFGAKAGTQVFTAIGTTEANAVSAGSLKLQTSTGNISSTGTKAIPPSRHYGKE